MMVWDRPFLTERKCPCNVHEAHRESAVALPKCWHEANNKQINCTFIFLDDRRT